MRYPPFLACLLLLPALAGCLHFVNPVPKQDDCAWRISDEVPQESKSCVYIFFFDPLDPLCSSNLKGLRGQIQKLGFGKAYYGQGPHLTYFLEKMHMIQGTCGVARFAVVGYGSGAGAARRLAERAAAEGLAIDLALYLEPDEDLEAQGPSSARATFTVRAENLPPIEKHGDEEHPPHQISVGKTGVPTHPETLKLLERELSLMAMTIPPPVRPDRKQVPLVDPIPSPRETEPHPKPLPEDWQFLRPLLPWEKPTETRPGETLPSPRHVPELPAPKTETKKSSAG